MVLEQLKKYPDLIRWDERGHVYFKGSRIPGTNFTDLLTNTVTNRASLSIPTMAQSVFTKALSDANVPNSLIMNKEQKRLLEMYKDIRMGNPYSPLKGNDGPNKPSPLPPLSPPPIAVKRQKRWASST